MFVIRLVWFSFVMGLAASPLAARVGRAESMFRLTPYSMQGGISIDSGSIVVVDNATDDLLLSADEIISFTVHATDQNGSFSFSGTGANAVVNGPIAIVNNGISLAFPSNFKDENVMVLEDPVTGVYAQWLAINLGNEMVSVSLGSRTGIFDIASVTAPMPFASMPEPESSLLALLGVLGMLSLRRRRAR